ncbi:HAD family hydrolase [Actinomyces sp. MRS3W]|uniref:HAD family hydrolase n=1 Tax=Actinomyces sp. MRS3W TaxID=2800796 RepID=UPI0028FD7771|nr:HAD family hydrolase [Actinomyces sp. MRS3W]MDU0349425.1 HAD family hydrolase [Actinomyces sp. MRS3W]
MPRPDSASLPPAPVDLRLVVSDMDGTLLDGDGLLPAGFATTVERMRAHGVHFAPASGRQLANLRHVLGQAIAHSPIIAENGTLVVQEDTVIHCETITADETVAAINTTRDLRMDSYDVGAVLAGVDCAYIERQDPPFLEEVSRYYQELEVVDDLLTVDLSRTLKVAVYDFDDAEAGSSQALTAAVPEVQAVVSGEHWTDLMPPTASKGRALAALQARLGVTPAQTAVFGDYLNDLDLYEHAELSFAMANAHPGIRAVAHWTAPANTDAGVVRTVNALLDRLS